MVSARTNSWGSVFQDAAISIDPRSVQTEDKWSRRKFLSITLTVSTVLWTGIAAAAFLSW